MKKIAYPKSYIAWDLETSGLKAPDAKILEIGAMRVHNGEIVQEKRWVLKHDIVISEEITAINGMTNELMNAEGRDPAQCFGEFVDFLSLEVAHLTHNGMRFDIPFLVNSLRHWKIRQLAQFENMLYRNALDTAVFVKSGKMGSERMWNETFKEFADRVMNVPIKGLKYNVGICCDELGIDRSKIQQHRALGDVALTIEIYKALLNQKDASTKDAPF